MKFRDQLDMLGACNESLEWVGNKTIGQAWKTCQDSQWMIWILTRIGLDLIDPICDIAERVLHLVPEDSRLVCSNAISAARRRANKDELTTTADNAAAAYYAKYYTSTADSDAAAAAHYAAFSAAYYAASSCTASSRASDCTYYAAFACTRTYAYYYAADDADDYNTYAYAKMKEEKNQCDILRKYFTIDQIRKAFSKLVA